MSKQTINYVVRSEDVQYYGIRNTQYVVYKVYPKCMCCGETRAPEAIASCDKHGTATLVATALTLFGDRDVQ